MGRFRFREGLGLSVRLLWASAGFERVVVGFVYRVFIEFSWLIGCWDLLCGSGFLIVRVTARDDQSVDARCRNPFRGSNLSAARLPSFAA